MNELRNISLFSTWNSANINHKKDISDVLNNQTFGQPVHSTHPHIINAGELVPGQKLEEFQQRRSRLLMGVQKYASDYLKNKITNRNHLVRYLF